jgi:lipopolysaccharide export system protein LptA
MSLTTVKWSLFLFLCCTLNLCFALKEDRLQTVEVSADSADLDQYHHRGVYIGHVQLNQGTTHLRAAEAVTEGDDKNELIKAIIKGNKESQAHYWTAMALDKPLVHAYADTICYYPKRHLIELIGHARVEQGNDSFSAPKISYDTEKQLVISEHDKQKTRTMIVIHPRKAA